MTFLVTVLLLDVYANKKVLSTLHKCLSIPNISNIHITSFDHLATLPIKIKFIG